MTFTLIVAGLLAAPPSDLPPELKKDWEKIETQLAELEERAGRIDESAAAQSAREIRQWIKELAIDAELLDDDPRFVKFRERLDAAVQQAGVGQKKREVAMSAAAEARAKLLEDKLDVSEEIRKLIKIPVDMNNISFKKDVAPIIQNACVRCHAAGRAQGSFDASTYDKFMEHIAPGKPEDSHILKLVTGKAEPRMPRGGQTRFDRQWAEIWTNWIKQGAKFDGPSKTAPLASYMIDMDTQRRAAIAALPESELDKVHRMSADRQLAMAGPTKKVHRYETPNFLVMTTLPQAEAEYLGVLAEATVEEVYPRFGGKGQAKVWKGRLGINVFADRLDYVSFAQLVDKYAPETHEFGHVRLNPEYQHLAMTADHAGATVDGMLAHLVAEAFVRQSTGGKAPPWVMHGYATTIASSVAPKDPWVPNQLSASAQLLGRGKTFANLCGETVPWLELAPMSAGFFHYLDSVSQRKAVDFVKSYAQSGDWQRAVGDTLRSSPVELQRGWTSWTAAKGGRR
jgi:hypothetical protein